MKGEEKIETRLFIRGIHQKFSSSSRFEPTKKLHSGLYPVNRMLNHLGFPVIVLDKGGSFKIETSLR
jgi:hypothetical protein